MFLHRVLPPPASSLLPSSGYHNPNVRRDSLQENRSMTNEPGPGFSEPIKTSHSPESPSVPLSYEGAVPSSAEDPTNFRSDGVRISRRREYSLSDVYQGDPAGVQKTTLNPPESDERSRPTVSPSQVCLCQPDPKVPRPRNAFILFRQHHQAEVAKNNPGLANPDISKIIGEYWRRSPAETKIRWKNLAEEEKVRHQKQYPEYRYQPRRAGRGLNATAGSDGDPGKCPKCGGRSMTAPRLPSPVQERHASNSIPANEASATMTPEQHVQARDQRPSPPSSGSSTQISRGVSGPYIHSPPPSSMAGGRYGSRAASYGPSYGSVSYSDFPKDPMSSPLISPDMKRRRFDSASGYTASGPYSRASSVNTAISGVAYDQSRRASLAAAPRPDMRKSYGYGYPPGPQSSAPPNPPSAALAPIRMPNGSAQSKSVEAMVMSIAPIGKVRTLAKIAKPLTDPGPSSPPYAARGALIAVEGTDDEVLKAVISHLRARLQAHQEHVVKLYYGGNFASSRDSPSFEDWLRLILGWHRDSADIRAFLTSIPGPSPIVSPTTPSSKHTRSKSSAEPDISVQMTDAPNGGVSPRSDHGSAQAQGQARTPVEQPAPSAENIEMADAPEDAALTASGKKRKASDLESTSAMSTSAGGKAPVPVAIIPRYQLTLTDVAASSIPIIDDYSPVDHWQWVASTWRGIVGPDVTIVVRPHSNEEGVGGEKGKPADVEVRLNDFRSIILRYEKGGKVGESALRRMGFEVEEWLRGRDERMGFGGGL